VDALDSPGFKQAMEEAGEKTNKAAELPLAVATAASIAAANDTADAPIPTVITQLNVLKGKYKWIKEFKFETKADKTNFYLIASTIPIYRGYTRAQYQQQQSQARAANYKYDPKTRTDTQLLDDAKGKPRTNENPAQASARAIAAQMQLAERKLIAAGRADLVKVMREVQQLEGKGRLEGFNDWLKDMHTRSSKQVVDGASELLEARRQAGMYGQGRKVKIEYGQDSKAPGKSLDISVTDSKKGTVRKIDVITPEGTKVKDAISGITHAAKKFVENPVGIAEGTVCFPKWPPKPTKADITLPNGDILYPGGPNKGKVFDNYFDQLVRTANDSSSKAKGFHDVSALNIIDSNGKLIIRVTNTTPGKPGGWTR
jgi:hypothetical protein